MGPIDMKPSLIGQLLVSDNFGNSPLTNLIKSMIIFICKYLWESKVYLVFKTKSEEEAERETKEKEKTVLKKKTNFQEFNNTVVMAIKKHLLAQVINDIHE